MASSESTSKKTLFVRNIPYSTKDADLEAVFSEYGPLKSCFTVKDKGVADKCRGFGYVVFADREDAERARSSVRVVGHRPVQVTFANRRSKEGRGGGEREGGRGGGDDDYGSEAESSAEDESEDDYETRTAKGGGMGKHHKPRSQRGASRYDIGRTVVLKSLPDSVTVRRITKKCKDLGEIEEVVFPVTGRDMPTAFVTFQTHRQARRAASSLNRASYRGSTLEAVVLSREGKGVSSRTLKKSRLIVRNLSFKCSEPDVKEAFSGFGPIVDVHIPKKANGALLGYGFVQFSSYFSAAKAIEAMNAHKLKGRPIAVDWVVPKDTFVESVKKDGGRVEQRSEVRMNEQSDEMKGDPDRLTDDDRGEGSEEETMEEEEDEVEEEEEEEEDKKKIRKRLHMKNDALEGKTVFIRNLPFDSDEGEVKDIFRKFGGVRYCKLTRDPHTEMCKGSAFVQFFKPWSVQRCLETAARETGQGVQYGGRRLDVSLALSREEVEKVKDSASGRMGKVDKRNLYLAKEGVILQDSEQAKELSKADMVKRMRAQSEKKVKLANPNFSVSTTRLSVRNLPTQVDEKQLKELFLQAAGGLPSKVKQVKIVRSKDRFDSKGVGRSKGYAFVDFVTHEAALAALRGTNNNPDLFGPKKRLIVEFALEDSRVLRLREQRQRRQSAKLAKPSATEVGNEAGEREKGRTDAGSGREEEEEGGSGNTHSKDGFSKKTEWKLKWKAKRLKRKETKLTRQAKGQDSPPGTAKTSQNTGTKRRDKHGLNQSRKNPVEDIDAKRDGQRGRQGHRRLASLSGTKGVTQRPGLKRTLAEQGAGGSRKRAKLDEGHHHIRIQSTDSTSGGNKPLRTRQKRVQKEHREEKEFALMVDKYKSKLFGSVTESRWFE